MQGNHRIEPVAWPANLSGSVHALRRLGEVAWLDGATPQPGARYSLIACRPLAVVEQFDGQAARLITRGRTVAQDASAWQLWRTVHRALPQMALAPWPVGPGWVGYLGFESARQLERLPVSHGADLGLPLVRLALFDRAIVLDHVVRRAYAVTAPDVATAVGVAQRDGDWIAEWPAAARADAPPVVRSNPSLPLDLPRAPFEGMVTRALEYIAAGDIYQVNLAHRFQVAGVPDALRAYAHVRGCNPAPYSALLHWDGGAIASFSPELFLQLRDGQVRTRPIKGTRPRTGDPARDTPLRRALLHSPKEAAELAMIIDLHRNDLGRVCRFGSVRVEHARRVEAHPTVFHTVADITGVLAPGRDALDLLAACFPAGSISGVPKIRALQIIAELEPHARGAYTGALGVVGLDGQMTMNVAIRTLQIARQTATLYVGGGIVADSTPAAEYDETLAKARGILQGLGVANSGVHVGSLGCAAGIIERRAAKS